MPIIWCVPVSGLTAPGARYGAPQFHRGEHRPGSVQLVAGSRGPDCVRSSGAQLDPLCSSCRGGTG
ncbi:hypothetical protein PGT21_024120 [Puccinia graminis f. sp. tritici]|uniref:Uncharacterized protein n=1 Tax=Puccinia graminis f. sp. tritici TaxID=56615 RepID=A0A5B0R247_PUCGR|nr:hypothetical protein PGT21_024120 [Puccinia graminis f. sp. tritici]